jgi:hypothetical protein
MRRIPVHARRRYVIVKFEMRIFAKNTEDI